MKIIAPKRLMESVFHTVRNGGIFNASSLDLQFARTKTLDSRITFTRASSGTFVGSDGLIRTAVTDAPRFDHNPTTGECLGLLVEEQRTNYATQSESFSSWTVQQLTQSTAAVAAPNGASTVQLFTEDTTTNTHRLFASPSTGQTTHTFSVFIKNASGTRRVRIESDDASGVRQSILFNLQSGTIENNSGSWTGVFIAPYPNGWYRIGGTITDNGGTTLFVVGLSSGNIASYTGDGTSGIYLWGAQLEAGAFPTSYIPTTTSAVTRSADVASISGTAFSSFYRQDQGTIYCQGLIPPGLGNFPTFHNASDGSANNNWSQYAHTSGLYANLKTGNVVQGDPGVAGSTVVGNAYRLSTAFAENNLCSAWNGVIGSPDTSAAMPTALSEIRIGAARTGGAAINTTISRLTYWPQRLSNSTLQEITR
jgi:hypothetical protein